MLELLYATWDRVSELIHLELSDVNMAVGFITCRDEYKERAVPFGRVAKEALSRYLETARPALVKGGDAALAFHQLQRRPHEPPGLLEDREILRGKGRGSRRTSRPIPCAIPLRPI